LSGEHGLGRGAISARTVATTSAPLWRLRLARGLPRYLVCALACAGLLASIRLAVFPPRGGAALRAAPALPVADRAAEGFAVLFARRYLTWDAAAPEASERLLAPLAGAEMAPHAGMTLPVSGAQNVAWAEVVQQRQQEPGAHVYTVAAQTDAAGLVYLAVGVVRGADGRLALSGYPSFVGPPTSGHARLAAHGPAVTGAALLGVVRRALRNYLASSADELAADLAPGADVAVPRTALALDAVQSLNWGADRRSVEAVVEAHDGRGARYTLGYELDVVDANGRWEVSAVEMEPDR
jgi:hypothetical protein